MSIVKCVYVVIFHSIQFFMSECDEREQVSVVVVYFLWKTMFFISHFLPKKKWKKEISLKPYLTSLFGTHMTPHGMQFFHVFSVDSWIFALEW